MIWDYAKLSKSAKKAGGPEKLVDLLVRSGKISVYPWLGVAFAGGAALTIGTQKVTGFYKRKRLVDKKAVENAKQELINGIEQYDRDNSTPNDTNDYEQDETIISVLLKKLGYSERLFQN